MPYFFIFDSRSKLIEEACRCDCFAILPFPRIPVPPSVLRLLITSDTARQLVSLELMSEAHVAIVVNAHVAIVVNAHLGHHEQMA